MTSDAPGWYVDPDGNDPLQIRWWDGSDWGMSTKIAHDQSQGQAYPVRGASSDSASNAGSAPTSVNAFCPSCGFANPSAFCPRCGAQQQSGVAHAPPRAAAVADVRSSRPQDTAEDAKIDNTFAWALAVTPLSYIFLDMLVRSYAASEDQFLMTSLILALIINSALVALDYAAVKRATGSGSPWGWALFLVPIYLGTRTPGQRGAAKFVLLWCATMLVYLVTPA